MDAILLLSDGTAFPGERFGADGDCCGEVVFNTSMTGYQEILSDPSYFGQIICLTYPHIGNYGFNDEDVESSGLHCSGLVVRECSRFYSNWRGAGGLESLMRRHDVVGIHELDTRALTRHIRKAGAMPGIIASADADRSELMTRLKAHPAMEGSNFVDSVTCSEPWQWQEESSAAAGNGKHVLVFDYGVKYNILRSLHSRGCRTTVLPAGTPAEKAREMSPDGIVLSNGPGDPAALPHHIENVRKLIGMAPIFGICLGHQLLGAAVGGRTFKLPFGHHGANHPVKNLLNGRVEITSQNHGFAVDPDSLPALVEITHLSLFDNTVEGMRHSREPVFSAQYHPEAAPGPHDAAYLFDQFIDSVKG